MSDSLSLESPVSDLLFKYVTDQIIQLKINLPELISLAGEKTPDNASYSDLLHDLRVASRRIVSVVKTSSEFMPVTLSSKMVWPYKYLLKNTARLRDLDVLCFNLNTLFSSQMPDSTKIIPDKLFSDMEKKRLKAWNRLEDKLFDGTSEQKSRFNLKLISKSEELFKQAFKNSNKNSGTVYNRIKDASAVVLFKSASKITAYGSVLNDCQDKTVHSIDIPEDSLLSSKDLHKLRLAFKEFRYNIEMFSLVYPAPEKSILDTVKSMQDALGSWHDMEFAVSVIEGWTRKNKYDQEISGRVKMLAASEKRKVIQMWYECKISELQSEIGEWLQSDRQMI